MAGRDLLLGIDIGTSSIKAAIFGPRGRKLRAAQAPCRPDAPHPGWAEIDPRTWWGAMVAALAALREQRSGDLDAVAAVGFSVLFPALVAMDARGGALAPAILYSDQRSTAEAAALAQRFPRGVRERRTPNRLVPGTCSVSSIEWLRRHRPEVFERTARFGHANTYIVRRLTGEFAFDPTNASLTGLLALGHPGRFDAELCRRQEVPMDKLAPIRGCGEIVGEVTTSAARSTGLRPGTPVVIGGGDAAVAAFGGGLRPGDEAFYAVGTTDCISMALDRPPVDDRFANCAWCRDGEWLSIAAMTSTGAAADWFAHTFLPAGAGVGEVERLACGRGRTPGARGLTFLPYLQGERTPIWDADARGAFTGIALAHERGDFARAVLEGVGCGVRQMVETLEAAYGMRVRRIAAVGGGTRNRRWLEIKASILDRSIAVLRCQECGVLGAAMLAGLGAGVYASYADALAATAAHRKSREVAPRREWVPLYEELYRKYVALYPRLHPRKGK